MGIIHGRIIMDIKDIKSFLANIELFKNLGSEELGQLAEKTKVREYKAGTMLFEQNTERKHLFIIYRGRVELFKQTAYGEEKPLTFFGSWDFLGEGSLMDSYPHSTSARIYEDSVILAIHRDSLRELMKDNPLLVSKVLSQITRIISRRMRQATNQVVDAAAQYISGRTRREHDLLGERDVPDEFYYGVQTLRAQENFNISGISINHFPDLIISFAQVKMAAAIANLELGILDKKIADAIVAACENIINGKLHTHFVVDMIQGGAGTSTNMNANEVIANKALEILGHEKDSMNSAIPITM